MEDLARPIKKQNPVDLVTPSDVWKIVSPHWKWYLLSVVVCLQLGVLYLLITPESYTRSSSVLVKQESKGNSTKQSSAQDFENIGLVQQDVNVNNVLEQMVSLNNLYRVVQKLNLELNYTTDGLFQDVLLYGSSLPVTVSFPSYLDNLSFTFDLSINKQGDAHVQNFYSKGQFVSGSEGGIIGTDSIRTPFGKMFVHRNPLFKGETDNMLIHVSKSTTQSAAKKLKGKITSKRSSENTTIIKLSIEDRSPSRAEDLLNTVVDVYNEVWRDDKNRIALATEAFIDDRLNVLTEELTGLDDSISVFKSENQITDLTHASTIYLDQFSRSDAEILEVGKQISIAQYIRDILDNKSRVFDLLPENSGLNNEMVEKQINEYNNFLIDYKSHLAYSSTQNPIIRRQEEQLSDLRVRLMQSILNHIETLEIQLHSLEEYLADATDKITTNPMQAMHLNSVERQQKVKESLYLFLLQKKEENVVSMAYHTTLVEQMDFPNGSTTPDSPSPTKYMIIFFVLGLAIPSAILFLHELMDTSIHSREDIEKMSTIPLVGEIPEFPDNVQYPKYMFWKKPVVRQNLLVESGSHNMVNEAFRMLRSNLEYLSVNEKEKENIFMITSATPDSGKTFVSMNLAVSIALKEKNVLIIDADLRKAATSRLWHCPDMGISDYLSGKEMRLDYLVIQSEEYPTLHILPVGTVPPNPTELLSSPRFATLLNEVRDKYDFILIDCPPVEKMADTKIVSKLVDKTLYVVRVGLYDKNKLKELEEQYQERRTNDMQLVLNGIKLSTAYKKYSYGASYDGYSKQYEPVRYYYY